jgi:hypothetical protein
MLGSNYPSSCSLIKQNFGEWTLSSPSCTVDPFDRLSPHFRKPETIRAGLCKYVNPKNFIYIFLIKTVRLKLSIKSVSVLRCYFWYMSGSFTVIIRRLCLWRVKFIKVRYWTACRNGSIAKSFYMGLQCLNLLKYLSKISKDYFKLLLFFKKLSYYI